jgi:hypothetical protein
VCVDLLSPIEAALHALTKSGLELEEHGQYAQSRRDLITSSTELQERNLIKMALVTDSIATGLVARGVDTETATFTSQAVLAIFNSSYDEWMDTPGSDLAGIMKQQLEKFRSAIT